MLNVKKYMNLVTERIFSMSKTGSKDKRNKIKGYAAALLAKNDEIANIAAKIISGGLVANPDTRELLIALNDTEPKNLIDHLHPYTHAPLMHTHIFGLNESWEVGNPRLWYRDDLVNHPELCALDGSDIPDYAAEKLSEIYPGTKLLTEPLDTLSSDGFSNAFVTLSVPSFKSGYTPAHLFGEELTISNFANVIDQWLLSGTTLEPTTISVDVRGDYDYRPDSYWIIPAAGTSTELLLKRPTPKSWKFEGSQDGTTWEVIDQQTDYTDWQPCALRVFPCETLKSYFHFRLVIEEWNQGDKEDLEPGLRRFWIFGRRPGLFTLPDITSPHPDFVWVVPYREMNTSMKNEDIGDIGTTSILPNLLPPYRMVADGRMLSREEYPDLWQAIGWTCDDRTFNQAIEIDEDVFTITIDEPLCLGNYTFSQYQKPDPAEKQYPINWVLEGSTDGETWEVISNIENNPDIQAIYYLDTSIEEKEYTKFRFTITEWAGTGPKCDDVNISLHYQGYFYIPDRETPGITTYIVTQHTAHDVGSDIIQQLQDNMLKLAKAHTSLQQQLQALLPDTEKE